MLAAFVDRVTVHVTVRPHGAPVGETVDPETVRIEPDHDASAAVDHVFEPSAHAARLDTLSGTAIRRIHCRMMPRPVAPRRDPVVEPSERPSDAAYARNEAEQAIKLDPKDGLAYKTAGVAYLVQAEYELNRGEDPRRTLAAAVQTIRALKAVAIFASGSFGKSSSPAICSWTKRS